MRKIAAMLISVSILAAVPVMAMEHGAMHKQQDEECARECDLLLRNCAQEVDSIQQRIEKIKARIKVEGADAATRDELRVLNKKLKEANETMRDLTKPGK